MINLFLHKIYDIVEYLNSSLVKTEGARIWQIFTVTVIIIVALVRYLNARVKKQSIFKENNIPYVKPHPIYGNLHELKNPKKGENEISVMEHWIQEHGKQFGFFVGTSPHLVVTDLDSVREVLVKRSGNYLNRPKLAIKAEPVVETLVGLRNKRWKEVRGMLSHAFTASKLKSLVDIMNEKVDILISLVDEINRNNTEIEWLSQYQGLTLEIISKCAFAMETNCMKDQNNDPFFKAVRDFLAKAVNSAVLWAQYFPFVATIMGIINNYWMKSGKATQMIIANLKCAITNRRKFNAERKRDILQIILDNAEEVRRESGSDVRPLSDKEIIANSWVFLLGGYETTASALTFTTYLLAKNPRIQEKLYEEIKENILSKGKRHRVTYDEVMSLSYLDQVLNESMRLYPPVTTFLQREATHEDHLNGTKVPKETTIVVPIWHIHHNPNYWKDPHNFDPERFSSDAKADPNRHSMSFIPFGAGPRNCIGMRFGQVAAKIALTRILSYYRIETCDLTPDPLNVMIQTVTLLPKEEVILRAIPRGDDGMRV